MLLEIGQIVKPHGLRGEVIVRLTTNRSERMAAGVILDSDRGPMEILHASPHQGRFIVAFDGVFDRDGAEALRGLLLRAEPIDDEGALWVHELIGAEVVGVDGRAYGTVEAVEANPASDLLVLPGGGLVPLTFVVSQEPGRVVIDPPLGLLD
ncbi:MAG: rRNA processing protein RimM [Acidimicrobiales bacterium]|nr:rRNA processing protein RimM [Acidimicrobiales bacterium]